MNSPAHLGEDAVSSKPYAKELQNSTIRVANLKQSKVLYQAVKYHDTEIHSP